MKTIYLEVPFDIIEVKKIQNQEDSSKILKEYVNEVHPIDKGFTLNIVSDDEIDVTHGKIDIGTYYVSDIFK